MAANKCNIPKQELEILARHFLPQIQAFFESEEGKRNMRSGRPSKPH